MISLQGPGWGTRSSDEGSRSLFCMCCECVGKTMAKSDDQHRLNSRQRLEIDEISQKFHFNLAPPPGSLDAITRGRKFVSLADFIEDFDWKYSDLDIIDRLEIKDFGLEDFWRYIAKSEVPIQEPGHLSPVTVAKGIEYGVKLLGCFIEAYVGSKQEGGKHADFSRMTRGALEFARGTFAPCPDEHNWYEHFQFLMKHPVINAGVQIAAWHRYRLPEDLLNI